MIEKLRIFKCTGILTHEDFLIFLYGSVTAKIISEMEKVPLHVLAH